MGVAPGIESPAAVDILLPDVHAAGVGDFAIDHDDLPVIAVIDGVKFEFGQTVEEGVDLHAGLAELFLVGALQGKKTAGVIVEDADLHAFPGLFDEQLFYFPAQRVLVRIPDEIFHVDKTFRFLDVREERVELRAPIVEKSHLVVRGDERLRISVEHHHQIVLVGLPPVLDRSDDIFLNGVERLEQGDEVLRDDLRELLIAVVPFSIVVAHDVINDEAEARHEDEDEDPGERLRGFAVVQQEIKNSCDDIDFEEK